MVMQPCACFAHAGHLSAVPPSLSPAVHFFMAVALLAPQVAVGDEGAAAAAAAGAGTAAGAAESGAAFSEMKVELLKEDRPQSDFGKGILDPVSEADVEQSLDSFQGASLDLARQSRLVRIMASMRPTVQALPKNADDRLTYQASRYALHRFMMQERSWYIRGLESTEEDIVHQKGNQTEWVPAYLYGLIVKRSGHLSASLQDLAVMAATIEDLVYKEISKQVHAIFVYLGLSMDERISHEKAFCALDVFIYYTSTFDLVQGRESTDPFRLPGNFTTEQRRKELCGNASMAQVGPMSREGYMKLLRAVDVFREEGVSIEQLQKMCFRFALEYHRLNDIECADLKRELLTMETPASTGRVTLARYHNKSQHKYWYFTEQEKHLREMGVLDVAQAEPTLIVSNYVGTRINCVEPSTLYALCCKIECDSILSLLEVSLQEPAGSAYDIEAIIDALVARQQQVLSDVQRERLWQLEGSYGGFVPLHSEAFSTWLHQVFPRECPQAHPEKSSRFPMTAGEWLHEESRSYLDEAWAEVNNAQADEKRRMFESCLLLLSAGMAGALWYFIRPEGAQFERMTRSRFGLRGAQGLRLYAGGTALMTSALALAKTANLNLFICLLTCVGLLATRFCLYLLRRQRFLATCAGACSDPLEDKYI
eukprot:TRINITY_DN25135_c0_g1_i1.p1 TRINITY_DN25135_c0_g1~~TRINITY_DN25135_c0_g1_i1.p1  ORF type:complete len:700 (-),score=159.56 TRINITY_DN25135_c0_g1_i1:81-2036(-)